MKHVVYDPLHMMLRNSDFLYELCLNKLSKMDNSTSSDLTLRPNLLIFLEFLQFRCKLTNPYYISENKIKLRNFNGNERMAIFKELFKDKEKITEGMALENYKRTLAGLFGPNPRKVNRNQLDHFDWREEFFVLFKFFKIYKLIENFGRKPLEDREKIILDLKNDLRDWLESYNEINKIYRNIDRINPYIHLFTKHTVELLEIHNNFEIFSCQHLEKLNHLTIGYYHCCSNKNKKDLSYLTQMMYKRNRIEYCRLDEFNEDDFIITDDTLFYLASEEINEETDYDDNSEDDE